VILKQVLSQSLCCWWHFFANVACRHKLNSLCWHLKCLATVYFAIIARNICDVCQEIFSSKASLCLRRIHWSYLLPIIHSIIRYYQLQVGYVEYGSWCCCWLLSNEYDTYE
jgi:hypothetical protein